MSLHRLDSFKHDLKHRKLVCDLLTQIFVLAEDTKRQVVPHDVEPLSLIDLIQASYLIFERNKIEPPDDAVYHRYLLALSMDPQRDWRTKISGFDFDYPPKLKPGGCSKRHRQRVEPYTRAINENCSPLKEDARKRHQSLPNHHLVRPASQSFSPKSDDFNSNATPKSQPHRDHFNDLLSLDSPIQRLSVTALKHADSFTNLSIDMSTNACLYLKEDMHPLPSSNEQWRAPQAVDELEDQSTTRDMHAHNQKILLWGTRAIFYWITWTFPKTLSTPHASGAPPLRIVQRMAVNVQKFTDSVHRFNLWHVQTAFNAWHHNAQRHKSFRIRRLVRHRAAVLETAFQCLQRWRLFLEMTKCAKDRRQWVYQRHQRSRLRLVLRHWRRLFEWKQQELRGENHYTSHSKRKVFQSWQQVYRLNREVQSHGSMARRKRWFLHWIRGIKRKHATRALLSMCLDQRRLRTLSAVWTRLRGNVFETQTARTRWHLWVEAGRSRSQHTAFQCWKGSVTQSKDVRERCKEVRQSSQYRVVNQHFQGWATWTERRRMGDAIVDNMTIARAHKQLRRSFKAWKLYRDVVRDQTTELVGTVACSRRQRIWTHWRKATGVRMATHSLKSAYRLHLLTMPWRVLVRNRHVQRQKERAATAFQVETTMNRKQQWFSAWQSQSCRKQLLRSRHDQLYRLSQRHSVLLRSWRHWRRRFGTRTKARLAAVQRDRYYTFYTFRLWKQGMVHGRIRRERSVEWARRRTTSHVHACFREWKRIVDDHRKRIGQARMIHDMVNRTVVFHRWTVWKWALETKRRKRTRLLSMALTWQRRQKHASFERWKTLWGLRKRHQKVLETMARTSKQRSLQRPFHTWRITCRTILASKRQYRRIQDERLRFIAKRALHQWNRFRLESMDSRIKVEQVQAHLTQNVLSNAWTSLFTFTQTRKFTNRRTFVATTRSCTQSKLKGLKVWWKYTRNQQLWTRQGQAAQRHLDALKMLKSIQALRRNARVRTQATAVYARLVSRRLTHVKAMAFSNWSAYSTRNQRNRQKVATFRYSCVLSSLFQHWKAFRTNRKDQRARRLQARHGNCQQRKKRAFNAWRLHVVRCRRIKKNGRNFKTRQSLRRWQRFHLLFKKDEHDQVRAIQCYQRSLCFQSLKQWSVTKRCDRVARTWAQRTVRTAFSAWLQHVQRLQHHVHSLWRQMAFEKGLTKWKHFTRLCQFNRC